MNMMGKRNPLVDGIRWVSQEEGPCSHCGNVGWWDSLSRKIFCPDCMEDLAMGNIPPFSIPPDKHFCVVCDAEDTIVYRTFPQCLQRPIEMHLCRRHIRALIERCLTPREFQSLRAELHQISLSVRDIFLLHHTFYDANGRSLVPIRNE